MKRTRYLKEEPFLSVVREEWKRCKKLRPFMKVRTQPEFFWHKEFGRHLHGRCYRFLKSVRIYFNDRYLSGIAPIDEFRDTVRHEFAHIGTKGHGEDFMSVLQLLGGSRYAETTFASKRKQLSLEELQARAEELSKQRSVCHSCKQQLEGAGMWNWKCGKNNIHHHICMPCKDQVALVDVRFSKKKNKEVFAEIQSSRM